MDQPEFLNEYIKIDLEEDDFIAINDFSLSDCMWTNDFLKPTINEYVPNETEIFQQKSASHQQNNPENFKFQYVYDQNEHLKLNQFQPTIEQNDILGFVNNPNLPITKIEQPSTSSIFEQNGPIITEIVQLSSNQFQEKPQAECINTVDQTIFNTVPVVSSSDDRYIVKYDFTNTVIANKPAKKPKNGRRTRIKYNDEHLAELRRKFAEDPYPSYQYFEKVASKWKLHPDQIKFWFQNERKIARVAGVRTAKPLKVMNQRRKIRICENTDQFAAIHMQP